MIGLWEHIAKLVNITPITMVYGIYNYSYCGESKPTYILGASHYTYIADTIYIHIRIYVYIYILSIIYALVSIPQGFDWAESNIILAYGYPRFRMVKPCQTISNMFIFSGLISKSLCCFLPEVTVDDVLHYI